MSNNVNDESRDSQIDGWLKVLNAYSQNLPEEDAEVLEIIKKGIEGRTAITDSVYRGIANALAGSVVDQQTEDLFAFDEGSNEARLVMLNKAAAFDTSAIDIQLKPLLKETTVATNTSGKPVVTSTSIVMEFNKYLNSYLSNPKFDFVFADAIKFSRAFPMAITLLGWDDNIVVGNDTENIVGDISCENIPIEDFWWDPASTSIEMSDYAFIKRHYPYGRVKQQLKSYKDFQPDIIDAVHFVPGLGRDKNDTWEVPKINNEDKRIDYGAIGMKIVFKKHYGSSEESNNIDVYFVLADSFVIAKTKYNISTLPFAILKEDSVPNTFTGVSSVMMAMPKIKAKYVVDNTILSLIIQKKTPSYLASSSSGIDLKMFLTNIENTNISGQYINGDVNNAIALVPTAPIDQELLLLSQSYVSDIDRMVSATDLINGVTNSSITGAAVRNKEEQATIKENTSVLELKRYLVRFVSILMEFLKNNMFNNGLTKKDSLFLRSKNTDKDRGSDAFNFWELKSDDVKYLIADVDIDVTLLRASKKLKQQNDLIQLYQIGLQYKSTEPIVTIQEIIEVLNIPNKEVILTRLSEESKNRELQLATQLVQYVMQMQQQPEYQQMQINDLTKMVLEYMNATEAPLDKPQGGI